MFHIEKLETPITREHNTCSHNLICSLSSSFVVNSLVFFYLTQVFSEDDIASREVECLKTYFISRLL